MGHPLLFEINTRCWLRELADQAGRSITLGGVPDAEFDRWKKFNFTHLWLMGVWTTGPKTRAIAQSLPEFQRLAAEHFPNTGQAEIVSSPYAVADYVVASEFGGPDELLQFRRRLKRIGVGLVLDFIPNHVGLDHPWLASRPDLFVQSEVPMPETFPVPTSHGMRWIAHGKDPHFPAWSDTAQLDYRRPTTQATMMDTLQDVARQCDGVRCDMAMLVLNDVFARTWQRFPCPDTAADEFWACAIQAAKRTQPDFIFMAEAYWNLEAKLQSLGFDYIYDKIFYDYLIRREYHALQHRSTHFPPVRFLENHDEPRIASLLGDGEQKAAAALLLGQPGMRLLHDGQLTGRRLRTPVQLARYLPEKCDPEITLFYDQFLSGLHNTSIGRGEVEFLTARSPSSPQTILNHCFIMKWQAKPGSFDLLIVNMAAQSTQVAVDFAELPGGHLEINLPEHGFQLLHCP